MHHPTDRIAHTTAFVTPVVEHWLEREIAQWVHPMKDRSDDPSHHEVLWNLECPIGLSRREICAHFNEENLTQNKELWRYVVKFEFSRPKVTYCMLLLLGLWLRSEVKRCDEVQ